MFLLVSRAHVLRDILRATLLAHRRVDLAPCLLVSPLGSRLVSLLVDRVVSRRVFLLVSRAHVLRDILRATLLAHRRVDLAPCLLVSPLGSRLVSLLVNRVVSRRVFLLVNRHLFRLPSLLRFLRWRHLRSRAVRLVECRLLILRASRVGSRAVFRVEFRAVCQVAVLLISQL